MNSRHFLIDRYHMTLATGEGGRCLKWVDAVEKGFWGGPLDNIDSRRPPNAQVRFKKSSLTIRLLRAGAPSPTFSTASVKLRKSNREQILSALPPLTTDKPDNATSQ